MSHLKLLVGKYQQNTSRKEKEHSHLCMLFIFIFDLAVSTYVIMYSTVSDNFVKFEYADEIYIFSHLSLSKEKYQ